MNRPLSEFDVDYPRGHVTRSGFPARIICQDLKCVCYPLVVSIEVSPGVENVHTMSLNGLFYLRTCEGTYGDHPYDLFNKPLPIVNIYKRSNEIYPGGFLYNTAVAAGVHVWRRTYGDLPIMKKWVNTILMIFLINLLLVYL